MVGTPEHPTEGRIPTPEEIATPLVDALIARFGALRRSVFVALDGRSGAGKSTLAAALVSLCNEQDLTATVIEGDQFYAGGSAERWDQRSPAAKADLVIDWRRQRRVLDDLRTRGHASWYPFDWDAPDWDTEHVPLRSVPESTAATDLIVLEGAYCARPELHDVLDVRVLLDTPPARRRRQLLERQGDEYRADWEARWTAAEDHYFGVVMPPVRFHHVL
jgi:uridine kinase